LPESFDLVLGVGSERARRKRARIWTAAGWWRKQSADGGRTWKTLSDRLTTMVHVTRDGAVYAFMIGTGLVRASERNLAWRVLGKGFGDEYLLHFAADPHDPKRLYAVTHNSRTRTQGVKASRDGGVTWTRLGA